MNYNQLQFWLLFLTVLVPYWFVSHRKQNTLLLAASYVFYGFWDYRFLFLILISTVIDFVGGLGVAGVRLSRAHLWRLAVVLVVGALLLSSNVRYDVLWEGLRAHDSARMFAALPRSLADLWVPIATAVIIGAYVIFLPRLYALPSPSRRKTFLVISMVANLAILGFFKYFDFFIASACQALDSLGVHVSSPVLGIILPAGISFYTFQAMSYTIDIYRGECEPTPHFGDFALFVCFFPHLVAGPIMRAHTLLPQVTTPRVRRESDAREGLALVLVGLFKKVVLSDNMAPIANAVFMRLAVKDTQGLTGSEVLVGIYAFSFQIYGDFSGYSSIARGISKWIGFDLAVNFHNPYLAVTPSDFWKRWHISLSSWLRDYLYIPLGGNRGGRKMEYRNLTLTMLLGGLWHGASWTFVAWGLYHGVILCAYRLAGVKDAKRQQNLGRWIFQLVVMFHLTCLGWLLFRADNFGAVAGALQIMFTHFKWVSSATTGLVLIAFYAGLLFVVEWITDAENGLDRLFRAPWFMQGAWYVYLTVMLLIFYSRKSYEFIYFQF